MPYVFNIVDDILIAGFYELGRDHNAIQHGVLRICRQENLKLIKGNCLFRCPNIPIFGEVISQQDVSPDARKVQALMDMPLPKSKRDFQSFLGIPN